jgi:hypothetical protein
MHQIEELLHCKSAFWPGQCSNFGARDIRRKFPDNATRHSGSRYRPDACRKIPINLKNSVAHLIRISEEQSERFYRLDGSQRVLQVGAATLPDRAGI